MALNEKSENFRKFLSWKNLTSVSKRGNQGNGSVNYSGILKNYSFCNRHARELRESAEREVKPVVPPGGEIRQIKITPTKVQHPSADVEEKRTIIAGIQILNPLPNAGILSEIVEMYCSAQ